MPYCGALLILAGSVGPLGFALTSQYGFGLHPCELCIWQRIPYGVLVVVGVLAVLLRRRPVWMKRLLMLAILLWLIEAGLGLYHVGVEQHWWESAGGCTASSGAGQSLDDLRAAILNAPLVSCDQPEFIFLGLSMAAWNMVLALVLAVCGLYVRIKMRGAYDVSG